jgi:CubicO group peptidase (beta-lactamase class C family)
LPPDRVRANARLGIGLGRMLLRRKHKPELVWHSGGTWGFRSFAAMVPERGIGVVVLANSARSVDRLGLKLVDLLATDPPNASRQTPDRS